MSLFSVNCLDDSWEEEDGRYARYVEADNALVALFTMLGFPEDEEGFVTEQLGEDLRGPLDELTWIFFGTEPYYSTQGWYDNVEVGLFDPLEWEVEFKLTKRELARLSPGSLYKLAEEQASATSPFIHRPTPEDKKAAERVWMLLQSIRPGVGTLCPF